jgi:hypothetical protein
VCVGLLTGEPVSVDRVAGGHIDGPARLVLAASLPFTRLAFCEVAERAAHLSAGLRRRRYFVRLHSCPHFVIAGCLTGVKTSRAGMQRHRSGRRPSGAARSWPDDVWRSRRIKGRVC